MTGSRGKWVRYALIALSITVVALLSAPFFIDINTYKTKIEQAVEDATGRHLTIGHMSASLFPWVGVELDDLHLANRPGMTARDFLRIKRLHIKLALLPLLSKRIEVQHFEVIAPAIYLERRSNGERNWGDLIGSSAGSGKASTSSAPAGGTGGGKGSTGSALPALAALQAESLSISDGEIVWVDGQQAPVKVTRLQLNLTDVQLTRPVSVKLNGALDGNAFSLAGQVGPLGDLAQLDPMRLPIQATLALPDVALGSFHTSLAGWPAMLGDMMQAHASLQLQLEQHPDGVKLAHGRAELQAAHKLALQWQGEMPSAHVVKLHQLHLAVDAQSLLDVKGDVKLPVQSGAGQPQFNLHIKSHGLTRTWLSRFVPDLEQLYAAHPAAWQLVQLSAFVAGDMTQLRIKDLQLMLDKELLTATGAVGFKGPNVRLRLYAKALHLDPWLPQPLHQPVAPPPADVSQSMGWISQAMAAESASTAQTDSQAGEPAAIEPDLRFLVPWILSLQLNVEHLFVHGLEMHHLSAAVSGESGQIRLNPLTLTVAGGQVKEQLTLNAAQYPVRWREVAHLKGVQAEPVLKAFADVSMLTGTMQLDSDLNGVGVTTAAVAQLHGHGQVKFRDGQLKGYDIAGAIRRFAHPGSRATTPQATDFAELSGSFKITNGIVNNRDLYMASPLLRVTGHGHIDLVQKQLDYHAKPRIVGTLQGQGGAALPRGLAVPLHIHGALADPTILPELDAKSVLERAPTVIDGLLKQKHHRGGAGIGGLLNGL